MPACIEVAQEEEEENVRRRSRERPGGRGPLDRDTSNARQFHWTVLRNVTQIIFHRSLAASRDEAYGRLACIMHHQSY